MEVWFNARVVMVKIKYYVEKCQLLVTYWGVSGIIYLLLLVCQ